MSEKCQEAAAKKHPLFDHAISDRYHANLVRTAPVLRADMILGKDECG